MVNNRSRGGGGRTAAGGISEQGGRFDGRGGPAEISANIPSVNEEPQTRLKVWKTQERGGFELCFGVKNFSFLFFEGFSLLLKRKREQGSRRWTRYFIMVHLQTTSYIQSTPQGDLALRTR